MKCVGREEANGGSMVGQNDSEQPDENRATPAVGEKDTAGNHDGRFQRSPVDSKLDIYQQIKQHPLNEMLKRIKNLSGLDELRRTMGSQIKEIEAIAKPSPEMQKLFADIEDQRKRIEAAYTPRVNSSEGPKRHRVADTISLPEIPPNPALKTNQKLDAIGLKFDEMLAIMTSAAGIATEIQSHAAHFLEKFDRASEQTDRAARNAMRVAMLAMFVSVVTAIFPFVMDHIRPDPMPQKIDALIKTLVEGQVNSSAQTQQVLDGLKQTDATADLTLQGLRKRDSDIISALRDLQNALDNRDGAR